MEADESPVLVEDHQLGLEELVLELGSGHDAVGGRRGCRPGRGGDIVGGGVSPRRRPGGGVSPGRRRGGGDRVELDLPLELGTLLHEEGGGSCQRKTYKLRR